MSITRDIRCPSAERSRRIQAVIPAALLSSAPSFIAASAPHNTRLPKTGVSDIITWSLILIVAVIIGLVVVMQLKRRLTGPEQPLANGGFTLSDLRRLHKEGQMSNEEFERAKLRIIGAAKMPAAKTPAPEPPSEKNDPTGPAETG